MESLLTVAAESCLCSYVLPVLAVNLGEEK